VSMCKKCCACSPGLAACGAPFGACVRARPRISRRGRNFRGWMSNCRPSPKEMAGKFEIHPPKLCPRILMIHISSFLFAGVWNPDCAAPRAQNKNRNTIERHLMSSNCVLYFLFSSMQTSRRHRPTVSGVALVDSAMMMSKHVLFVSAAADTVSGRRGGEAGW